MHTTLSAAYEAAKTTATWHAAHEITEAVYYDAMGCVPPVYGNGRFWVGEIYTVSNDGRDISLECWIAADRYFCRLSPVLAKEPAIGSPEFAEYWEATYGRENLDATTLRNIDAMKGGAALKP